MSRVFVAHRDQSLGRQVVIKVLPPDWRPGSAPGRFLREIEDCRPAPASPHRAADRLGRGRRLLFYVMPFVEGESLRARLAREGELPLATPSAPATTWPTRSPTRTRDGVVHRDIKPDNVLLSGRHALITDFGVAKAVSEATGRHAHHQGSRRHAGLHGAGAGGGRRATSIIGPTSTRSACWRTSCSPARRRSPRRRRNRWSPPT